MKAQDMMSQDNNRAEAIRRIQAFCDAAGYEYSYTEKKFTIKLPSAEPLPITPTTRSRRHHKEVDTSGWGPPGPVEGEDQELPPIDEALNEGSPE